MIKKICIDSLVLKKIPCMYSLTKIINNINIDSIIAGSMNVRSYLTTRQEGRICWLKSITHN